MSRRWLSLTAILCLLLIASSLLAAGRGPKEVTVFERDGYRTSSRTVMGLFSSTHEVADPTVRVSDDLRGELRRLRLTLSPEMERLLPNATRSVFSDHRVRYSFSGEVAVSPKKAVDSFVRQIAHPRRFTTTRDDQMNGLCADGRSQIDMVANVSGRTIVNVGLEVAR